MRSEPTAEKRIIPLYNILINIIVLSDRTRHPAPSPSPSRRGRPCIAGVRLKLRQGREYFPRGSAPVRCGDLRRGCSSDGDPFWRGRYALATSSSPSPLPYSLILPSSVYTRIYCVYSYPRLTDESRESLPGARDSGRSGESRVICLLSANPIGIIIYCLYSIDTDGGPSPSSTLALSSRYHPDRMRNMHLRIRFLRHDRIQYANTAMTS
jgi:hypothetical protein